MYKNRTELVKRNERANRIMRSEMKHKDCVKRVDKKALEYFKRPAYK